MVDSWIAFCLGPLFKFSMTVLILGLLYRFGSALAQSVGAVARAADKDAPYGKIVGETVMWVFPVRGFGLQPLIAVFSVALHVGLIGVALFGAAHANLVGFPAFWPRLGSSVADVLALVGLVGIVGMALVRALWKAARALSSFQDAALLVVLGLLLLTGLLGANPEWSPVDARVMVLAHVILGNLALVLTPTTKLAHCVTFPFVRLVSFFGWRNPPQIGKKVEVALDKEGEPV